MRARVPFAFVLSLSLLTGSCPVAAAPPAVALLPAQEATDPATAAPTSTSVATATSVTPTPEAAVTPAAPGPSTARKPLYRRWWLWTIVGAVIAQGAVAGAIVGTPAQNFVPTIPSQNPGLSGLVRF